MNILVDTILADFFHQLCPNFTGSRVDYRRESRTQPMGPEFMMTFHQRMGFESLKAFLGQRLNNLFKQMAFSAYSFFTVRVTTSTPPKIFIRSTPGLSDDASCIFFLTTQTRFSSIWVWCFRVPLTSGASPSSTSSILDMRLSFIVLLESMSYLILVSTERSPLPADDQWIQTAYLFRRPPALS